MDHLQGRRPPHSAERSDELKRAQRQRIMRAELLANLVDGIAMLDAPSGDDIRRFTRAKLSAVPGSGWGRKVPGSGWGRNWSASGGSAPAALIGHDARIAA